MMMMKGNRGFYVNFDNNNCNTYVDKNKYMHAFVYIELFCDKRTEYYF